MDSGKDLAKNEGSLIAEIKRIVKREMNDVLKRLKADQTNSTGIYNTVMDKARINSTDAYSSISTFTNAEVFDNKNAYQKMKNRVNYGFNTDGKTFVNKAPMRRNK